jgi:thiol:disulfide interchange protein DsbA
MSKRFIAILFGLALFSSAKAAETWEAGKHYFVIEPPQPTATGDKIEVLEVFSYACPACNAFQPFASKIKSELPPNAEMGYLPAAFRSDEDWPVFQRAFFAAQALGLVDKTHEAVFDAIWKNDGPLRITDPVTHKIRNPLPTIEDVAKFYANYGVSAEDFTATANSFAVNTRIKRADAMIKAYGVDSTPTIIVNGKYRMTASSAGGWDKIADLVKYLVDKETAK